MALVAAVQLTNALCPIPSPRVARAGALVLMAHPGAVKRTAERSFEHVVVVIVVRTPDCPLLAVLLDHLNPADQTIGVVHNGQIFGASSIPQVAPTGQVGKVGAVWGPRRLAFVLYCDMTICHSDK